MSVLTTPEQVVQLTRSGANEFTYNIDSTNAVGSNILLPINTLALAIHPDSDIDQCQIQYVNKAGETITAIVGVGHPHFFQETAMPFSTANDRAIRLQVTSLRNWSGTFSNNGLQAHVTYGWGLTNELPSLKIRAYFGKINASQIPTVRNNKLRIFSPSSIILNNGRVFAAPTFGRRWVRYQGIQVGGGVALTKQGYWIVNGRTCVNFLDNNSFDAVQGITWASNGMLAAQMCSPWRFDFIELVIQTGVAPVTNCLICVECGDY